MDKSQTPKFQIGDTIVVTLYGTVGKVTNIKELDDQFLYEVNYNEGLFTEQSLILLSDYEGSLVDSEQIDIEYKFFFGDLVQVKGYGNDLFKVVGFRTEIWRYKEDAWEDIIYELTRLIDGEWLEADEDELILIADSEHAETVVKKYGWVYPQKKTKLLPQPANKHQDNVDRLLDTFNDYQILYAMFSDPIYKKKQKNILQQLMNLSKILNEEKEKH
ncbi:hypothetical protein [Falsibacillus albus]|uniref:YodN n=1 Tax=Falsibacillus albus TaxID=2478915 RepID=A0A3L7JWU8_9BACI|nr:hypothetical protein [Falsibacillus albus]RLQ95203.1 hypothetical protein D9X91_11970 [Falsibacillus albus]